MTTRKRIVKDAAIASVMIGVGLAANGLLADSSLREESKTFLKNVEGEMEYPALLSACLISSDCSISVISTVPVTGRGLGC